MNITNITGADSQLVSQGSRLTPAAEIVYGYLSRRPNRLVTYEELRSRLFVCNRTINTYVRQINRQSKAGIKNIRGIGYIFPSGEKDLL